MRSKSLVLSAIFSVLVLSIGAFAYDIYGITNELGGMVFLAIVMGFIISGINLSIQHKLKKDTGEGAKLSYPLTIMGWVCAFVLVFGQEFEFLNAIVPLAVAVMVGVIVGSLFQLAIFWGVEHSGDPVDWVLRGGGKYEQKELRYKRREEKKEEKEQHVLLKIFHLFKEHPGILREIQGAMVTFRGTEGVNLIEELKTMYRASKKMKHEQEVIDKLEAGTYLIEDAIREQKGADWAKTSVTPHSMKRINDAVTRAEAQRGELLKDKDKDLHLVTELMHLLNIIIKDNATQREHINKENKHAYAEKEKVLKELRTLMHKLKRDLSAELSISTKIKRFGAKARRKNWRSLKKGKVKKTDIRVPSQVPT